MTEIQVIIKSVYGNECIYPITHSEELQALTGKKTLLPRHVDALKKMGFTFKVVTEEVKL